jgi:hypothetical protein
MGKGEAKPDLRFEEGRFQMSKVFSRKLSVFGGGRNGEI